MKSNDLPTPITREEMLELSPQPGDRIFHYGMEFEVKSLMEDMLVFHGRVIPSQNSSMPDKNYQVEFSVPLNSLVPKLLCDGNYAWGIADEKPLGDKPVELISHTPETDATNFDLHFLLYYSRNRVDSQVSDLNPQLPNTTTVDIYRNVPRTGGHEPRWTELLVGDLRTDAYQSFFS